MRAALPAVLMALWFAWMIAGCAVTTVYEGGEIAERSVSFGTAPVPETDEDIIRVETRGLGYVDAGWQWAAGYYALELLLMPRDCGAAIIVRDADAAARLLDRLGDTGGVCIERN